MSGSEASIRKGMERTRLRKPARSQYKGARPERSRCEDVKNVAGGDSYYVL